jgi:hypothetical protein
LTQLTILWLFSNELSGTIPSSLCSLALLNTSIDCGEFTCDCCDCRNE